MRKTLTLLLITFLIGLIICPIIFSQEVIVDYEENSLPVLNEELRNLRETATADVDLANNVTGTLGVSNLDFINDDSFGDATSENIASAESIKEYVDTMVSDITESGISILDYNTNFSSSTQRGNSSGGLKIAYGSTNGAVGGNSSQAITNLPFTSTGSYHVAISSVTGALSAQPSIVRNSGSQFTWKNNHSDNTNGNGNGDWIAIGY